jgi:hypothetical protein
MDISKCKGNDCPIKSKCYRYTAVPDQIWQCYADFKYENGECEYFIENSGYEKTRKNR